MVEVVRVLVVDDSAYVRKVVKEMLSRSAFLEVVGVARDGGEALEMVERLKPDVVTCDLIMPGTDGVDFIRKQMAIRPIPIIVVSIAAESSERVLSALDAGAVAVTTVGLGMMVSRVPSAYPRSWAFSTATRQLQALRRVHAHPRSWSRPPRPHAMPMTRP